MVKSELKKWKKEGLEKKEIFERADELGYDRKKVTRFLSMYPNKEDRKKYALLNYIVIGIYLAFVSLWVFVANSIYDGVLTIKIAIVITVMVSFIPMVLIYLMATYNPLGYVYLALYIAYQNLRVFEANWEGIINIAIVGVYLGLVYYVKKKLFPFQNYFHTEGKRLGCYSYY